MVLSRLGERSAGGLAEFLKARYTVTVHTYAFHKRLTHSHTLPSASFVTNKYNTRGLFSVHKLFFRVHKWHLLLMTSNMYGCELYCE